MDTSASTRISRLPLAAAFLLCIAGSVRGQAPAEPSSPSQPSLLEGAIFFGGGLNDNTGNPARASEYDMVREGAVPRLGAIAWGDQRQLRVDMQAHYGGSQSDQMYVADLSYARWITVHARYLRQPHRLEHDPLTYVDSASGIGGTFVVSHTDTDPSASYSATRGEFVGRVEIAPPSTPMLRFFVGHRQNTRSGERQSLTTNHCATCHVVSYSRGFDERTREISAGARLALRGLALDYSYTNRRFSDDAPALMHTFDRGVHPATLADVFLNRLQYDARTGPLAFDLAPASRKKTHVIRGNVALPRDAGLSGTFTRSDVESDGTGLQYSYTGGSGRIVVPLRSGLVFRGSYRRYDIDADDVAVDVVELVAPAGPLAGKTYAQAYPSFGNPDYVRRSALSRTPADVGLDLAWTPVKRTTVQAGYAWQRIARRSFEVPETTTNSLIVRARSRPWQHFESRTRFQRDWITDPFLFKDAAIPAVLQPFASPGNVPFTGLQYYEMYDSRQADLTSLPTRSTRFDQSFTWSPSPRVSLSGHYRLNASDNDGLNFSTWSRTLHAPGAEIWITPGARWSLMAGYSLTRERLDTMFSVLAFNG